MRLGMCFKAVAMLVTAWLRLLIIFVLFGCAASARTYGTPLSKVLRSRQIGTQSQIVNRLFSTGDYDPYSRPPVRDFADHPAIVVITSVFINRVVWRKHNLAEVDLYLREQWLDSRLTYEVDPRENIHEVPLPKNRNVWKPDTFFIGAEEQGEVSEDTLSRVVVEPSGYVRSSEKRSLSVSSDSSGWPLSDRKTFKLKISSYSYPIEDVVYLWANSPPNVLPVEVSAELLDGSAAYSFVDASAGDCVGNYSAGVHSCISVSITFKGCATGGLFKIFLPTVLLVVASWLHFWIHGSWSVPRTISAAGPFFILISLLLFLPTSTKPAVVWLVLCVLITFCSLLEYFLVICCSSHQRVRYTNGLLHPTTTTVIHTAHHDGDGMQGHNPSSVVISKEPVEMEHKANAAGLRLNNNFDLVSRIAFPIVFLVLTVIFLLFYSF